MLNPLCDTFVVLAKYCTYSHGLILAKKIYSSSQCNDHTLIKWCLHVLMMVQVGVLLNNFNDYDDTFDGCLFRGLDFGVYSRAGISYLRNTRFEGSRQVNFAQTLLAF